MDKSLLAPRLLYFSPVPWASYAQRPHQMVRYFLALGGVEVLWVDPYPTRLPEPGDWRRVRPLQNQSTPACPGLAVLKVPALPVEPLPGGAGINRWLLWRESFRAIQGFLQSAPTLLGIGRPSALALAVLNARLHRQSFYDAMDDFPEFYHGLSRRALARREGQIAGAVDEVLVSSTFLAEKFRAQGGRVRRVGNACDLEVLPENPIPAAGEEVVVGYLGTVARWFDWQIVQHLALCAPGLRLKIVGPCFTGSPVSLPENIHLEPSCPHPQIGHYLSRFTLGLIPFKLNPLTRGVDPIKFYEYRAMGLPVLTTRFGEMGLRSEAEGVFFLEPGSDLRWSLEAALAARQHPCRAEAAAFRAANNWRVRFAQARLFAG